MRNLQAQGQGALARDAEKMDLAHIKLAENILARVEAIEATENAGTPKRVD